MRDSLLVLDDVRSADMVVDADYQIDSVSTPGPLGAPPQKITMEGGRSNVKYDTLGTKQVLEYQHLAVVFNNSIIESTEGGGNKCIAR